MLATILNIWGRGLVIAALPAIALRFTPRVSAVTRERIWWATLIVVCVDGLFDLAVASPLAHVSSATSGLIAIPALGVWMTPGLAVVWLLGALAGIAGVAAATVRIRRAKRRTVPFPRPRLSRLLFLGRVRLEWPRKARVRLSTDVPVAAVLGGRRPVIAVNPDVAERVSDEDLDRVLVHEHSHIERRDDWATLCERIISSVCWCHPAVWVICRALDFEREAACDEEVVAATGDAGEYAACLARIGTEITGGAALAVMPSVLGSPHSLRRRISRLLAGSVTRDATRDSPWVVSLVAAIVLVVASLVARSAPALFVAAEDAEFAAQAALPFVPVAPDREDTARTPAVALPVSASSSRGHAATRSISRPRRALSVEAVAAATTSAILQTSAPVALSSQPQTGPAATQHWAAPEPAPSDMLVAAVSVRDLIAASTAPDEVSAPGLSTLPVREEAFSAPAEAFGPSDNRALGRAARVPRVSGPTGAVLVRGAKVTATVLAQASTATAVGMSVAGKSTAGFFKRLSVSISKSFVAK